MSYPVRRGLLLAVCPCLFTAALIAEAHAQIALPEIVVTAPSPIQRPSPSPATNAQPGPATELQGTLPIVTDQFATVTVVPNDEIRRSGASTLGDLLFGKPGITGSSFAPGASSRPVIRGLDVNRVRIQENGIGANGASDLGEDHFVPVDPLTTDQVEVIRGPATLRFGSQAIGGVVETTNNRIPTMIPLRGISTEFEALPPRADKGLDGAVLLDAGAGNFAFHADAFGRKTQDYRVPHYPYLNDASAAPNATQPGSFNGRQPNSGARNDGHAVGASYIFNEGFVGLAVTQDNALYHIPGIDGEDHHTRIDAKQTKVLTKGEWRAPNAVIDALRFWGGATDYKHNEIGLADTTNFGSDGIRQTFTNKEQEGRVEAQLAPFNLRFASLTTAIGVQGGHQELTAPSPDNAGLWDPNSNRRIAGYMFNEFKFSDMTKIQLAGRIERVNLSGVSRQFDPALGMTSSMPVSPSYTPKSASFGLIQNFAWDLVGSLTAQYVERAPKPAELFSGGGHDATATFDKGNPNLKIEAAESLEVGLRRAKGPFRFEATAYYTRFKGFILQAADRRYLRRRYRHLRARRWRPQRGHLFAGRRDFRGAEFQSQWDLVPLGAGMFGIENQFDVVRATFTDGTNVPRIPPVRVGGGLFWRDANWLARVQLLHAFAQNDIAGETPTSGYDDLRAELSYKWKPAKPAATDLSEVSVGISGSNLLNRDIRNHVSYSKDEVLMPGASVRLFTTVRY